MEKVEILDSIRNLAITIGRVPTRNEFREKSGITDHKLLKYFPSWREALREAGLESNSTNVKLDDEDLLIDWGNSVREHRQIPTRYQYKRKGKYGFSTFQNHFGMWSLIPDKFRKFAQGKPEWEDVLAILPIEESKQTLKLANKKRPDNPDLGYVDSSRLNELRSIKNNNFDLTKLIRLCEELNECYEENQYFAVAMLVRAIVDHVPPIFGKDRFSEVANNYGGSKSFKESMHHLETSLRKIADSHLHVQIRNKEVLPNKTQVNFTQDIDVLLSEVVRLLK